MSFQRRITLLAALAVAIAIVVVAAAAWLIVRAELRGQIDDSLTERARIVQGISSGDGPGGRLPLPPSFSGGFGDGGGQDGSPPVIGGRGGGGAFPPGVFEGPNPGDSQAIGEVVDSDGNVLLQSPNLDNVKLPTEPAVAALESGSGEITLSDETVDGVDLRVAVAPLAGGGSALVLARSLQEVNDSLSQLLLIMALVAGGGAAVAAGLGWLVGRTALAPARRLTETAEEVARTEDLTQRIDVEGDDELARLGISFNSMLAALERSVGAQRRLVADASHELRTPLTSLRTNIETLTRSPSIPEPERSQLLDELREEMEELGRLVDDIVDLAREGAETGAATEPVDVRLDELVDACVERARRRASDGVTVEATLTPALVRGAPERLDRAVGNLLDNAVKWTPEGGRIVVRADAHGVRVEDSGPGISEEDAPHVFERFWRARSARGTPGSGLGLAIVKQVATTHGGSVAAGRSDLGGARLDLALPGTPLDDAT